MRRQLLLASVLGLSLLTVACTGRRGGGGGGGDDDDAAANGPLVRGLSIDGLALYQGVRIDILDGDDVVFDDAPVDVIAGRDGMLRVFVVTDSDWETRTVAAVAELDVDGETMRFSAEGSISSDTSDGSLSNSLNIDIPGESMTRDTVLVSVKLVEVEDDVDAAGDDGGAEWEAPGGSIDFDARDTGTSLRVILVPIEYRGDGSGRMPDISEEQLQIYRDAMYAQYPTREFDLEVGATMVVDYPITYWGEGWGEALEQLLWRRDSDGASFEEYYYGVFAPAQNFQTYCQSSCYAGLSSLVQSPSTDWLRGSLGLGFSGEGSAETMVHEIGHAHGREHAPCQVQGAGYYPHSGARIGVQGYDLTSRQLKDPNTYTDFMGYCDQTWVSDYTYNWLADRIDDVNASADVVTLPGFQTAWSSVRIDFDGTVSRGIDHTVMVRPQGQKQTVAFLDASGAVHGRVDGSFHPYSHLDGGRLVFPSPLDDKVVAVRLESGAVVPW